MFTFVTALADDVWFIDLDMVTTTPTQQQDQRDYDEPWDNE